MLQLAQQAATQQNWSQVTQALRHCTARLERASSDEQEQALELALDALFWGDFQDRWELIKVLPYLGMPAFKALERLLLDEGMTFEIRWFAARMLGAFQDPIAVSPLVNCLRTASDPEVIQVAALALASLGEVAIAPLTVALADPEQCAMALQALTQIHHAAIIDPLLTVVAHPDPHLRALVIEALSNFQQPRLVPVLITALQDTAAAVRKEAVIGLGLWATTGRSSVPLFEVLQPCLWDLHLEVCQQAAIALGRLGSPEAVTALSDLVQTATTPPPLQREAIRALGRIETRQMVDAVQGMLPTVTPESQVEIIQVLGRLETAELKQLATQVLLGFFETTAPAPLSLRVLKELTQAWARLQSPIALDALEQLAESEVATIRLHAIAAMKQLKAD
ncbi:MAG: HEAT repeat domain-containing protein [Cyanobacteria bacterium P01_G01_bin.54]